MSLCLASLLIGALMLYLARTWSAKPHIFPEPSVTSSLSSLPTHTPTLPVQQAQQTANSSFIVYHYTPPASSATLLQPGEAFGESAGSRQHARVECVIAVYAHARPVVLERTLAAIAGAEGEPHRHCDVVVSLDPGVCASVEDTRAPCGSCHLRYARTWMEWRRVLMSIQACEEAESQYSKTRKRTQHT